MDDIPDSDKTFSAHRLMIVYRLDELGREIRESQKAQEEISKKINALMQDDIKKIWVEISYLKMKSGIWGALGGIIPLAIAIGLAWLDNSLGGKTP